MLGAPVGPSYTQPINNLFGPSWNTTFYPGNGVYAVFNIASLYIPSSQTFVNLLPTLIQLRYLDILIQNDTNVDWVDLYVTTELAGDMNGDGMVDLADLTLLATYFNQPLPPGVGDPNSDGFLDLADLAIVQAQQGMVCPDQPPSSLQRFPSAPSPPKPGVAPLRRRFSPKIAIPPHGTR